METLRVFSIPLIVGVIAAVVLANIVGEAAYTNVIEHVLFSFTLFGREIAVTPHWLINDIFMVFFFGIAAVHIVTDRKSTRLNSSHVAISYAVFCLKKKRKDETKT